MPITCRISAGRALSGSSPSCIPPSSSISVARPRRSPNYRRSCRDLQSRKMGNVPPISADLPRDSDIIQNPELPRLRSEILRDLGPQRTCQKFRRSLFPRDHSTQMILRNLWQAVQIRELVTKRVVGSVKPIPPSAALSGSPVDTERSADRVPEFVRPNSSCFGKISMPSERPEPFK